MHPPGTATAAVGWKPLIVCPNEEISHLIRSVLAKLGLEDACHLPEYPRAGDIAGMLSRHGRNICFLDVDSNQEQALLLISEAAPAAPVVALNPRNDADLILRCLRRGACEFLTDTTVEQAGGLLERLARLRAPAEPGKRAAIYCVVPGKAGCGASTVAVSLAVELSRHGLGRVLLVDTDVVTGTIAFLLKLKPEFHLGDAVRDSQRLDSDLWGRMAVPCHGIDVLPAPEDPSTRLDITRQTAAELLAFWRQHYEAVVLDVSGVRSEGFEFVAVSDEILLITTNELPALHATRRFIECLEHGTVDRARLKLVVNRYTPATGLKRDDIGNILRLQPYGVLGNDFEAVQNAVLDGHRARALCSTSEARTPRPSMWTSRGSSPASR